MIEDDYAHLAQAQVFGPPSGLETVMRDPVFRLRATTYWFLEPLWNVFHLTAWGYHLAGTLLHFANVLLLYGILAAWPRMRQGAFWAAAFFAIHQGHQEAVMWVSAVNELLQFFFGAASLLCWIRAPRGPRRWLWEAASTGLFLLALLSKESAIILLPLFFVAQPRNARRLWAHLALAGMAVGSLLATRAESFRFTDGSFSLSAPFWITWPRGVGRVLWFWGWLAGAAVVVFGKRETRRSAMAAGAWIAVSLIPYIFLTYSTRIPSRQTYLASAGLALLVGLALSVLRDRRVLAVAAAAMLLSNVGYLWIRKRAQFIARAEPTERLIELARQTDGPIRVRCFPRNSYIAESAVLLGADRPPSILIWTEAEARERPPAAEFCYQER